ncbi:MAG: ATP synthase F1 subunit delta [Flavobacteriales bacterium]|nr:ATP synthase F1 subunit delta [Flavobacteriales bacterium]
MQDTKVAIRYAKALVGLSAEKGLLEQVFQDMSLISSAIGMSHDLQVMLKSPIIAPERKLNALNVIFSNGLNEMTRLFLRLLMKNGREDALGLISKHFISQYKELKGITTAQVVSAAALSDEMRKRILEILNKEIAGTVELETRIDPELVGGFVLNIGDRQLDASIRSKFSALRQEFNTNQYAKQF